MSHPPITRGSRVKFDKDGTTLTGTVFHIISNIENGRKMAVIEIEHELPGITVTVPFNELIAAPISKEYALLSNETQVISLAQHDQRFVTAAIDTLRAS